MRVLMVAALCAALGGAAVLGGCGSVRPEDQAAWVGQPVSKLETQPVLLTMQLVRTTASDGTEIRNYVNGQSVASCSGGGSIYKGAIDYGTYADLLDLRSAVSDLQQYFLRQERNRHRLHTGRHLVVRDATPMTPRVPIFAAR